MMLIDHLSISNYRSLADINVELPGFMILVGRNNAGKSNILSAINLLLEGSTRDLSLEDFHCTSLGVSNQITIEAHIKGVTAFLPLCAEQHRSKIQACIEEDSIRIRRIANREPFGLGKLEIWQPEKGEFGTPTGLDSAFKQFLPEVIYIEAFKDPSAEAQSSKTTTVLSKILKQIVEQVGEKINAEVQEALSLAQKKFNVIEMDGKNVDERPDELKRVQQRINNHVREIFTNSEARLVFKLPDLDAMMATATVELRDHQNGPWTSPAFKGQGFQRALYVALLEALADELRHGGGEERPNRPFILLFEEPEIFLHPSLQREIGDILETISKTNQVVIVTHSPLLVTPHRIDEVLIVKQQVIEPQGVKSICVRPKVDELPDAEDKQLASLLRFANSAEFLFADFVVVVEGPSDRELLNASWTRVKKEISPENNYALAVLDAGSKAVVPVWVRHLKAIGLETVGLVDMDFLWDGAGKCLKDDSNLSQLMSDFWKICDDKQFREDKNGKRTILASKKKDAFIILRDELQHRTMQVRKCLMQQGIWVLLGGEIEDYFGLTQNSKGQYTLASQKILSGKCEIPDEVQQFLRWSIHLEMPIKVGQD